MKIYTAQIIKNDHRKLPNPVDISIKSSTDFVGKFFAPTWGMVRRWKSHEEYYTWQEYTDEYELLIYDRIMNTCTNVFETLTKTYTELTLLCYCQENQHCHRNLVKKLIKEYCEFAGFEFEDGGFIN